MNFFEFADNLSKLSTENFLEELQIALEQNQYVKQLQIQQWNEGIDSDGKILGIYTKATEILSDGRKKAGETYDIFDTGATRRNLMLVGFPKSKDILFFFDSDSTQVPELMETIGPRLFGLTAKNLDTFVDFAQDAGINLLRVNMKID